MARAFADEAGALRAAIAARFTAMKSAVGAAITAAYAFKLAAAEGTLPPDEIHAVRDRLIQERHAAVAALDLTLNGERRAAESRELAQLAATRRRRRYASLQRSRNVTQRFRAAARRLVTARGGNGVSRRPGPVMWNRRGHPLIGWPRFGG